MSTDNPPKSAVELAMERLRQRDAEAGIVPRALTDEQKAAIAEVRNFYQAKIAEQEVLHQSHLLQARDPDEYNALEAEFAQYRERLAAERESKIEKIRAGEAP